MSVSSDGTSIDFDRIEAELIAIKAREAREAAAAAAAANS